MARKMTLRLNDREDEALKVLSEKLTYNDISSKAVRYAVLFLHAYVKSMKLDKNDIHWHLQDKIRRKSKLDLPEYGYY